MPVRRLISAAVAAALCVGPLAACAKEPDETTCADYLKKSEQEKWSLIKDLAKQDGEPVEDGERGEFVLIMDGICDAHRDKTIKDAMNSVEDPGGPSGHAPAAP